MRAMKLVACAAALLATCCASHHARVQEIKKLPDERLLAGAMLVHADTAFLPDERSAIEQGCHNLERQTGGVLVVEVVFDLDMATAGGASRTMFVDSMVRSSVLDPLMREFDAEHGMRLLGIVPNAGLDDFDPQAPKTIYVVAGRLKSRASFVNIVMHEVLHALGVGHVLGDPSAIMSPTLAWDPAPTCLDARDARAICTVYACDPSSIGCR